jgi:bifunctional non-homologous end joining protein LigD
VAKAKTAALGVKAPLPTFVEPMLATLWGAPFDDPGWLYEVKWDGFRVEAVVDRGTVRLWTRGGQDAARYFGPFLDGAAWLDARTAILDGEVMAFDDRGEPDFALLQDRMRHRATGGGGFVFQVFDLLYLDGRSLLAEPLLARKTALRDVLREGDEVRYSEHRAGDGMAFFELARQRGLEGVMAKDAAAPYLPGKRSDRWRKLKIRPEQELVVGGWTRGTGAGKDLGALLVGVYEDGALRYTGKVGAFSGAGRAELLEVLAPLVTDAPPFDPPPPRRVAADISWVRPELVIRAEFAGWTGDGMVRQASYKGFDVGKDPRRVVRELAGKR